MLKTCNNGEAMQGLSPKQNRPCCAEAASGKRESVSISNAGVMAPAKDAQNWETPDPAPSLKDYEKAGFTLCRHVEAFIETGAGPVPVIKTRMDSHDLLATFFVRCGIKRHNYTVTPGLYAVGKPDTTSEVLVTANFKLTFDHLRKELAHINAWVLVLDTKGVNVWCAAGKGTFATAELVRRIKSSRLEQVVNHRRVVVPQLGATGVSAGEVKKQSGFSVTYGPVRACDIPAFLKNNRKADKEMRQVTFTTYERFILTPVEIQIVLKPALITAFILFVLSGFGPGGFSFSSLWDRGPVCVAAMAAGIISGAFLTPLCLPIIPFRQFALKGMLIGGISALLLLTWILPAGAYTPGIAGFAGLFLFSVTVSSYLAMNFTGTTPFTSPSGVELEMKRFIPVQLAFLIISTGLWVYSAF